MELVKIWLNEIAFVDMQGIPDFSELGELSDIYDIGFGLGPENPPTSIIIKKHLHRKLLYSMCPLEVHLFNPTDKKTQTMHFCVYNTNWINYEVQIRSKQNITTY